VPFYIHDGYGEISLLKNYWTRIS